MILIRKKLEKIALICLLTAYSGQVYFNPFGTSFRFTFGVIILSLMLIFLKDVSIYLAVSVVAVTIFSFRSFAHFGGELDFTWIEALNLYAPGALYYIVFGILFDVMEVREKAERVDLLVFSLWICDSVSNIVELAIRRDTLSYSFESAILAIILVGIVRAILTMMILHIGFYYLHKFKREQKEKKYKELILFMANLKTELFFLRKSIFDIEEAMKRSYHLYERLRDNSLKNDALMVAKDIHEIKKDYTRVVLGIEKTLSKEDKSLYMSMKEILYIIKDNTHKLIESQEKQITLNFDYYEDFLTREYYPLISILNNLIINAIEAIQQGGVIELGCEVSKDYCIFKVIDNGKGIDSADVDLVFEPGYSTKFNPDTGEMSTGIGLTHVKHIVETYFEGEIKISSEYGERTAFVLKIPSRKIIYRM